MSVLPKRADASFREQPCFAFSDVAPLPIGSVLSSTGAMDRGAGVSREAEKSITPAPQPANDQRGGEGVRARNATYHNHVRGELNERQQAIYTRIIAAGSHGVTLDEISAATGLSPNQFSGRVTELEALGKVRRLRDVRRPTRAGAKASVIVASQFITESVSPALTPKDCTMTTMTTNDSMPDQLTCSQTPRDQHGELMEAGRVYRIDDKRVQCFDDEGALWVQRIVRRDVVVDGSRPQLVGELPADVVVFRL